MTPLVWRAQLLLELRSVEPWVLVWALSGRVIGGDGRESGEPWGRNFRWWFSRWFRRRREGTAIGIPVGGAIGYGMGFFSCASSAGGSGGSGDGISGGGGSGTGKARKPWKLGGFKSTTNWANQMAKRGWTPAQIDEAIDIEGGAQYGAVNNVNPGNPAARYVNPTTGRSVVIDNVTVSRLTADSGYKCWQRFVEAPSDPRL